MKIWTAQQAEKATGGKLIGSTEWDAFNISIDSRTTRKGDLFIALRGTKTDGHDFLREAFLKGATAVMVEKLPENFPATSPIIQVDDCIKALYKMAEYRRRETNAKVIAVTGSVGKTSTKEMLNVAFSSFGITHVSAGNNNNEIGAPLSVAKMPVETEYAIFELGMNHAGEIRPLSKLIRPHVAIITSIAEVHMEHFGSLNNIAEAKAEIFEGLEKGGTAIISKDTEFCDFLSERANTLGAGKVVTFGENVLADVHLVEFNPSPTGSIVHAKIGFEEIGFHIAARGKHMAINALGVLAAVDASQEDVQDAAEALSSFSAQKGRGQILQIAFDNGKITVIDESYNASPVAMRAALGNLGDIQVPGRKIAIIGDMLELGDKSEQLHVSLLNDILNNGVELVYTVGKFTNSLFDKLPLKIRGKALANASEVMPELEKTLKPGDVVLVKASHGIGLGQVVEELTKIKAYAV